MIFTETPLAGCYTVSLEPMQDERGWFARTYCKKEFFKIGHTAEWLQLNHSFTNTKGSLRGMHFQLAPFAEIKLVRCIAGAVFDVVVDLRKDSASFLKWFGVELSASSRNMIYIPEGFAHGFQALTDDCELIYHHSQFYEPGAESGLKYDDPMLNINWPLPVTNISDRDNRHLYLDKHFKGL